MLFNSIEFAIFVPIVFILYWFVTNGNLKLQNLLLLVASYVFYGWWDWRFLSLIVFSSIVDYLVGIGLSKTDSVSFVENYRVYKDRKYFFNSAYHLTENERDTRTISIYEHLMSLTKICDAANY
jgi:D-alanyl-lipoteichoic acid acyltransferase DltB (MBOAT superfamily)